MWVIYLTSFSFLNSMPRRRRKLNPTLHLKPPSIAKSAPLQNPLCDFSFSMTKFANLRLAEHTREKNRGELSIRESVRLVCSVTHVVWENLLRRTPLVKRTKVCVQIEETKQNKSKSTNVNKCENQIAHILITCSPLRNVGPLEFSFGTWCRGKHNLLLVVVDRDCFRN